MPKSAVSGERAEFSAVVRSRGRRARGSQRDGYAIGEGRSSAPPLEIGVRSGRLFGLRRRKRRSSPVVEVDVPGIEVTGIPAGLWVRSTRNRGPEDPDVELVMPAVQRWPAIVLGAPGEPRPEVHECARVVESLSVASRANFGLIVYGWEAASVQPYGQRLAERLGGPVTCYHGMPYYTADGGTDESVVGAAGNRTWRPFATASVHRPGCPPVPCEWRSPAPRLEPAGTGSYRLAADWMVDVLPSGLLVRPVGVVAAPEVWLVPPHPGHVNLVFAAAPPPSVRPAVERMANSLPAAARSRLRLVAVPGFDHLQLGWLARALRVEVHALGRSSPKSPLLVRRFVEPPPDGAREVWGCGSCDTNNLAGNGICRRCGRERRSAAHRRMPGRRRGRKPREWQRPA